MPRSRHEAAITKALQTRLSHGKRVKPSSDRNRPEALAACTICRSAGHRCRWSTDRPSGVRRNEGRPSLVIDLPEPLVRPVDDWSQKVQSRHIGRSPRLRAAGLAGHSRYQDANAARWPSLVWLAGDDRGTGFSALTPKGLRRANGTSMGRSHLGIFRRPMAGLVSWSVTGSGVASRELADRSWES